MKTMFVILSCLLILGCSNPTNVDTEKTSSSIDDKKTYYTVTFMNGDSVYETQTIEYGQQAPNPAVNPVYSDYEFQGWSYQNNVYWGPSKVVVLEDTVLKAAYSYTTYEITEGTFVSSHYDSERNFFDNLYYIPSINQKFTDMLESLKRFSTEIDFTEDFPREEVEHYNTYTFSTGDIEKKLDEVRNDPGTIIIKRYDLEIVVFNHEGDPLFREDLRSYDIPLAGYTWIAAEMISYHDKVTLE
jgi:hypothetical protein